MAFLFFHLRVMSFILSGLTLDIWLMWSRFCLFNFVSISTIASTKEYGYIIDSFTSMDYIFLKEVSLDPFCDSRSLYCTSCFEATIYELLRFISNWSHVMWGGFYTKYNDLSIMAPASTKSWFNIPCPLQWVNINITKPNLSDSARNICTWVFETWIYFINDMAIFKTFVLSSWYPCPWCGAINK